MMQNINLSKITTIDFQELSAPKAQEALKEAEWLFENAEAQKPKEKQTAQGDKINAFLIDGSSISKEDVEDYIQQLSFALETHRKEDKKLITDILLNNNLNSSDILSIMASHPGKTDWLVSGIKKHFSGNEEKTLLKTIANACAEIATDENNRDKGIAEHRLRTIKELKEQFPEITPGGENTNIKISSMIVGIRG